MSRQHTRSAWGKTCTAIAALNGPKPMSLKILKDRGPISGILYYNKRLFNISFLKVTIHFLYQQV